MDVPIISARRRRNKEAALLGINDRCICFFGLAINGRRHLHGLDSSVRQVKVEVMNAAALIFSKSHFAAMHHSFKHPLYLGGAVARENVYVADFLICNKLNSTLWEQVKDVPDGAEVQIKIM